MLRAEPDRSADQASARQAAQDTADSLDALEAAAAEAGHHDQDSELHDEPAPRAGAFALYDATSEADQW